MLCLAAFLHSPLYLGWSHRAVEDMKMGVVHAPQHPHAAGPLQELGPHNARLVSQTQLGRGITCIKVHSGGHRPLGAQLSQVTAVGDHAAVDVECMCVDEDVEHDVVVIPDERGAVWQSRGLVDGFAKGELCETTFICLRMGAALRFECLADCRCVTLLDVMRSPHSQLDFGSVA